MLLRWPSLVLSIRKIVFVVDDLMQSCCFILGIFFAPPYLARILVPCRLCLVFLHH